MIFTRCRSCIDLSNEMIRYCKERGLTAQVMDFYNLDFDDNSFHAVYAAKLPHTCFKAEIHQVIKEVKRVIKPEGLFNMGMYGGTESEGIWMEDSFEPKRFFVIL